MKIACLLRPSELHAKDLGYADANASKFRFPEFPLATSQAQRTSTSRPSAPSYVPFGADQQLTLNLRTQPVQSYLTDCTAHGESVSRITSRRKPKISLRTLHGHRIPIDELSGK
jgi:hypothetical protein